MIVTAVDDNGGVGTATYSLVVNPALAISPATLPTFVVGTYYSQQLVATGGSGVGYVYLLQGTLPPGLTMSESGLISGTPTSTEGIPFGGSISVLDSNLASTWRVYEFAVRGAAVATTLTSSANPSSPGQSVVFTASVAATTAGLGVPTGTVSFMLGSVRLGVAPLIGGVATFATSGLEPGPHAIFAVYNGDAVHAAGRSSNVVQSVLINSATSFAASPETAEYGRPVVFTMSVASYEGLFPTGLVGFYAGDVLIGTALLDAQGVARGSFTSLATGQRQYKAIYAGDAYFRAVASSPIKVEITRNDTSAGAIVSSEPQVYYGEAVTLTATFTAVSAGSPMTGTVAFYDGDVYLGSAPMTPSPLAGLAAQDSPTMRGQAVLPNARLSVGEHVIRAVYAGDANYAPVTSLVPVSVLVDAAGTSTRLAAAAQADGTTLLTAVIVATTPGDPPLDGTVSFYNGTTLLGTVPVANGSASLNVGALPLGVSTLRAVYTSASGDSSASASEVVIDAAGPRIVGLSRYGFHFSPTTIALAFNSALDAASAQDPANYRISRNGGRLIPITRAVYDPATSTVTLYPAQRLNLHWTYNLVVNGRLPRGVAGASGVGLDGSGRNEPGTDFATSITWRSLSSRGGAPAVTFLDGTPQETSSSFNSHVNSVVRRTAGRIGRMAPVARLAPMARMALRPFRVRSH